jgi:hypothetical protein
MATPRTRRDTAQFTEKTAGCRRGRSAPIAVPPHLRPPRRNFPPVHALIVFHSIDSAIRVRNRY